MYCTNRYKNLNRLYYEHINIINMKIFQNVPFCHSLSLLLHLLVHNQQLQLLFQHLTALRLTHLKTTNRLQYLKQWQYLYPNREKQTRASVISGIFRDTEPTQMNRKLNMFTLHLQRTPHLSSTDMNSFNLSLLSTYCG